MKDFEERVVAESDELDAKIEKLKAFLASDEKVAGLDVEDIGLLTNQLIAMNKYSKILKQRVGKFEVPGPMLDSKPFTEEEKAEWLERHKDELITKNIEEVKTTRKGRPSPPKPLDAE